MPALDMTGLSAWLEAHWLALLVAVLLALVAYRVARPLVHRLVVRAVRPVVVEGVDPIYSADESAKRVATIEDLLAKLLRALVIVTLALVLLTVLGLLPVLAGLAVVAAAVTLAGQSIVLDYLMGLLILIEGQYSKGDWIAVGAVEGTVEEVGIRRTIVRDSTGTVHSISNGQIRTSSNLTRVFANMVVDVTIADAAQVERAMAVIDEVGLAMAADPAWRDVLLETPRSTRVTALSEAGLTLRATARIRAAERWSAPSDFRRRLVTAFRAAGIALPQRDHYAAADPPVASLSGVPAVPLPTDPPQAAG
ncbi:MAG: mechanosensitive ion channel domain-containing protein [Candidatus Limnocylindrales bacterium]